MTWQDSQEKQEAIKPSIPIIALTAYAMARDRAKLLATGMDEYVAKPVEWKTLLEVIGGVLERR